MKKRGEQKQFKSLLTNSGVYKQIGNTQAGQKIIFDEALRISPLVCDWINNKSGVNYRGELKEYFDCEEKVLTKVVECFLYMAGSIYATDSKSRGTGRHKRVNSLKDKLMPELSFENVWRFLEVIIDYSKYFSSEKVDSSEGKRGYRTSIKYTCSLSEVILEEVALVASQSFYPLPMTTEPVPWKNTEEGIVGGYETYQYEMVRSTSKNINYNNYSQSVFESINYIQSVPWIVNDVVLAQLKSDLKQPVKKDFVKTEFPNAEFCKWGLDLTDKENNLTQVEIKQIGEQRTIYQERAALYNAEVSDYESAVGKYRYAKLAISIAEQYVGKVIYFPHSFDFRGRIYPLPIGLSPQGSDAIKALLLYANREPLNESGLKWCWAYMASLWGDDKLPFEERILRGKELINADYKEADEPYQFLSHQIEMQKYIQNTDYQPSIRIHLDACNSGSQFTSAITGDLAGCKATNVIPSFKEDGTQNRQDAYILVSNKSIELCNKIINEGNDEEKIVLTKFIKSLLEENGRKICKVPVMVSNYGGTSGGRSEILWNMLRELGVERKWITKKVASFFSKIIGDSITGVLNGGKAFETYIQEMNNLIAKSNKPVIWTTSDGFHVVHSKNKELKPKKVSCIVPGARRNVVINKKVYSDSLSASKMKSAISPNFIHSLDAELLRKTALRMLDHDIYDTDWIHDSFGCHPNYVDLLLEVTKEEFMNLMLSEPLKLLDIQLREQIPNTKKAEKQAELIKVPELNGFTEKENLEKVMVSDWFFS